jgi:phage/plasmid-like protein (TIGR03299 family)
MSANVETMTYFGQKPWHGLGTELTGDDVYSIDQAILKSGLDWAVSLETLKTEDGKIAPAKAVVRSTDQSILGVVGKTYKPLQNQRAFNWFQPFVDSKAFSIHTAGSLDKGKKVWVLAKNESVANDILPNDKVESYLLLSNSHDGTLTCRVGFTPIRVVCQNTLSAAHSDAQSKLIRLRHSQHIETNLDNIQAIVNTINSEFEATLEQYKLLTRKDINQADIKKYVNILFDADKETEEVNTKRKNLMEGVIALTQIGLGTEIPGVRGTMWGLYNAYTEYLTWKTSRNNNNRMKSLWFGQNLTKNNQAFALALKMCS